MRRVLFISYYFPPSVDAGSKRALGFFRHLHDHGWEPVVLTVADGNYATVEGDPWRDAPGVHRCTEKRPRWAREGRPAGRAESEAAPPSLVRSVARHLVRSWVYVPDAFCGFHAPALAAARRLIAEKRCDAVLTSSSPYTLLRTGAALARETRLPWIADLRDLWLENQYGYPYGAVRRAVDTRLERRWLRQAAAITTTTDGQAEKVRAKELGPPVHVVRNGFMRTPTELHALAARAPHREDETFRITFAGKIYEGRKHSVAPFLDALDVLRERAPAEFARVRVDFYGRVDSSFLAEVLAFGLEDQVTHHGLVPRERAEAALASSDAGLVVMPRHHAGIVVTKTYDCFGALTPALLVGPVRGEAARLVGDCEAGAAFDARDPDAIADWLLARLREPRPGTAERRALAARVERFSYSRLVGELAAVLDGAVD